MLHERLSGPEWAGHIYEDNNNYGSRRRSASPTARPAVPVFGQPALPPVPIFGPPSLPPTTTELAVANQNLANSYPRPGQWLMNATPSAGVTNLATALGGTFGGPPTAGGSFAGLPNSPQQWIHASRTPLTTPQRPNTTPTGPGSVFGTVPKVWALIKC